MRNKTKAMELFTRAANLPKPHPAALQVLGSYYHRGPSVERNLSLAKHYYEMSAELGDSAGYYRCVGVCVCVCVCVCVKAVCLVRVIIQFNFFLPICINVSITM